jgi:hypothetical protein
VSNSLKRNTTKGLRPSTVFINVQRTEFESKSQQAICRGFCMFQYLSMFKEPKLKANHNKGGGNEIAARSIYQCSKNRN